LAAAALLAFASTASAQSAVTLYGVIDQGLSYTKDVVDANHPSQGNNQLEIKSGNQPFSRFGLRGREDLGAGLSAVFVLEGNIAISGEQRLANNLFGRQSYVGIASRDGGTVTLGRQFGAASDFVAPFSMASGWAGAIGSHYGNFDTLYNQEGRKNTLKYATANYQGFSLGGTVSLGGKAGAITNGLSFSAGAGYANGPLRFGAAFVKNSLSDDELAMHGARLSATRSIANADQAVSQHLTTNAGLAKKAQIIAAGGSYVFGPAKVGLVYTNTKLSDSLLVDNRINKNDALKTNNIEASLQYHATPALLLGLGYNYTNVKVPAANIKVHQLTLGGQYDLSKRTAFYLTASAQRVKDGGPLRAKLYGNDMSTGDKQLGVRAGIRHSF
jgi:predicted porin